jgi:hypothetical protein
MGRLSNLNAGGLVPQQIPRPAHVLALGAQVTDRDPERQASAHSRVG